MPWYSYPNLRSQALTVQPDGKQPGTEFNYNNYNPELLGMILERTTHMPVAAYLQEKISNRRWHRNLVMEPG